MKYFMSDLIRDVMNWCVWSCDKRQL